MGEFKAIKNPLTQLYLHPRSFVIYGIFHYHSVLTSTVICSLTHGLHRSVLLRFEIFGAQCVSPVTFFLLFLMIPMSESRVMCNFNLLECVELAVCLVYIWSTWINDPCVLLKRICIP